MGKCQNCEAEDVPLKKSSLGTTSMEVCTKCYAAMEQKYWERLKREECLKRKRRFI
jgi:hypothetical protein